jgi:hypothetical protein
MASMIDDRTDAGPDDEVGDVADDVIYVDDADAEDADDVTESVWASVVTGAQYALNWSLGRRGGADGTGAG